MAPKGFGLHWQGLGRAAEIVETPKGVLHFKTDCSLLDEETVLATHRLAGSGFFRGMREIVTPEGEEAAANALRVNDVVFVGADYPRTIDKLDKEGYKVVPSRQAKSGGSMQACHACRSGGGDSQKKVPKNGSAR